MAASGQQYTPLPGAPTAEAVAVNLGDVSSKRRAWRGGLCECFGAHMLAGCFTDALPQSALRPHASAGAYVVISSAIFPCPKLVLVWRSQATALLSILALAAS